MHSDVVGIWQWEHNDTYSCDEDGIRISPSTAGQAVCVKIYATLSGLGKEEKVEKKGKDTGIIEMGSFEAMRSENWCKRKEWSLLRHYLGASN